MWWCNGPVWGGWSMFFWLMPILFLVGIFIMFRFCRHGVAGCCGHDYMPHSRIQQEIDRLREEVAALKKDRI